MTKILTALEVLDERIDYYRKLVDQACRDQDYDIFYSNMRELGHLKIVRRMLTGEEYEDDSTCQPAPDKT
jgi:hypothetical protein